MNKLLFLLFMFSPVVLGMHSGKELIDAAVLSILGRAPENTELDPYALNGMTRNLRRVLHLLPDEIVTPAAFRLLEPLIDAFRVNAYMQFATRLVAPQFRTDRIRYYQLATIMARRLGNSRERPTSE